MMAVIVWLVLLGAVAVATALLITGSLFICATIIVARDSYKHTRVMQNLADIDTPVVEVWGDCAHVTVKHKGASWRITYTPGEIEFDSGRYRYNTLTIAQGREKAGGEYYSFNVSSYLVIRHKLNETAYDYCHSLLSDHYKLEKL